MKFTARLTKQEKRIIKKSAKIQLESLHRILNRESEDNVDLYCAMREVPVDFFDKLIKIDIQIFEAVYNNPRSFLMLDEKNISIIKHIMENFITQISLQDYKSNVWRKFNIREQFIYQLEN